jgi:hypothetical protein
MTGNTKASAMTSETAPAAPAPKGLISEREVELLKRKAKKLRKELGCTHASALTQISLLAHYPKGRKASAFRPGI